MKAQKIHTFSTEVGKKILKRADGRLAEACLVRDLFGSILYLALGKKVDKAEVIKYQSHYQSVTFMARFKKHQKHL